MPCVAPRRTAEPQSPSARPGRLTLLAACTGLLLALGPGRARGDVVTLTSGQTLEGKVVEQDDAHVVIETTFDGRRDVPRAEVRSVDVRVPPLREQLAFRLEQAGTDAAKLWAVHDWARGARFKDELKDLLERILRQTPEDAKARKLLGHEKVEGRWMSPAEKAAHLEAQQEAAQRAKGLVPYQGRWVTPREKEALEQGLLKDGDDWVTEEEYHRRRGEQKVDGQWTRVGAKEATGYAADAGNAARVTLVPHWGPHFDVLAEVDEAVAKQALEGLEASYGVLRRALAPADGDLPETLENRVRVALFRKAPAYARFCEWFGARNRIDAQQPGWSKSVQRQPAFWWVQTEPAVAVYQFPNTDKTLISNAVHNAALVLLTKYRMNYRFPPAWLREGFAYVLEMESIGYSLSFTLGRGGGTSQGGTDTAPPWADSAKWKQALKAAVAAGQDPPLKRMASLEPEQMGYPELVKAWSVVDYLIRRDRTRFKAFVDQAKHARDAPEEDALQAVLGMNYRQVDEAWRAWVAKGFGTP